MQKARFVLISTLILLSLAACDTQPACPQPEDESRYLSPLEVETLSSRALETPSIPIKAEIGGKMIAVDKVVTGPLCNDHWKGTIYVACDVQVAEWEEKPLFLKNCNLSIEPDTVVYVAYHNDAAYYNGCSCHASEQP